MSNTVASLVLILFLLLVVVLIARRQQRDADILRCTEVYAVGREACALFVDNHALVIPTQEGR